MLLRKAARCVRHPSLVRFEIERRSRLREVSKFDFRPYMSAPISNIYLLQAMGRVSMRSIWPSVPYSCNQ